MRFLAIVGALALLAVIGGAFYFFSGYYSVAAAEQRPRIVDWALMRVRIASIERYATDQPPRSLDDPATIQAGARAFADLGCANCHGAPGVNWAKFSEGLNPGPPDLKEVTKAVSPAQMFWVIKNGIGMTAMPSFGLVKTSDDEIWSVVAFIKTLGTVSPQDYQAWSAKAP